MKNDFYTKRFYKSRDEYILKTRQEIDGIIRNLRSFHQTDLSHNSDDYELVFDFGGSSHYYILFPKDPNSFKVISNLRHRGPIRNDLIDDKKWIHDGFLRLITHFPKTFELYYGDFCFKLGDSEREVWFKPHPTFRVITESDREL